MTPMSPVHLRTEYRINPTGIEETEPRFSWQLEGTGRNRYQKAFQIMVATSPEALDRDEGALWDTGMVVSSETLHVVYAGAPLASRQRCWWKVRAWDMDDVVSDWSEAAFFSMGLLNPEDWSAQWIGYEKPDALDLDASGTPPIASAQWIWFPEGNPRENAPAGERWFLRAFTLPEDAVAVSARMLITADNAVETWINGEKLNMGRPAMSNFKRVYQQLATALVKPGENLITVKAENGDGPAGMIGALRVILRDGTAVDVFTDNSWKCTDGRPRKEYLALDYDDSAWKSSLELGPFGCTPWTDAAIQTAQFEPVPHLRRAFSVKSGVKQATLYATALGLYAFQLNGDRVGEHYFTPGWTDYRKRLYYHTYDVTKMVRPGEDNVLGALLSNGWYAGHVGLWGSELWGTRPKLMAQLEIEYEDGSRDTIATDGRWRAAHGEIRGADLLMGETRDKRKALEGWGLPKYDDSDWDAVVLDAPEIVPERIQAYPGAPVKHFETLPARSQSEPAPGVYVYDLGQNMVGWARIRVNGSRGQRIQIRFTEMLQDNGMIYTDALRGAQATDTYILAGNGVETLEPLFTFHGFRYVEVRGLDAPPALADVEGIVLNADVPITAEFSCSEPLLNQLAHNIRWGLKGNFLEAPTDCPQRDERLGWTGDAQFFMPTALYTADIGAFYTKWLVDLIQDAQLEDGSFAHVSPDVKIGGGAVAWGDAAMICPWLFYQFYGDTRVLERHFDNMVKGMNFLETTSNNYIRDKMGFGDWLNLGGGDKDEFICTAYFAYLADIMAQMADIIGRDADAARYAALHRNIRQAFVDNFVDDEGRILESSQTGYALAFAFDLIPEHLREAAAEHYINEIARFDWHLATGFIGTPRLLPTLSQAGRDDVAYRLLMNTTYPSWLFQVTLGATTMWERWNGWTPDQGFGDPDMNSFNHYAFGAVGEWLYSRVAGIRPDAPGFARVNIAPVPGGGLTQAGMTYRSIRGTIVSEWKIEDGIFILNVEIPANVTALVCIPTNAPDAVTEGGTTLEAAGIPLIATDEESVSCRIGSGTYRFEAPALP